MKRNQTLQHQVRRRLHVCNGVLSAHRIHVRMYELMIYHIHLAFIILRKKKQELSEIHLESSFRSYYEHLSKFGEMSFQEYLSEGYFSPGLLR